MREVHVRCQLTPVGERQLTFGANLAASLAAPLHLWVSENSEARALLEAKGIPHDLEVKDVRNHIRGTLVEMTLSISRIVWHTEAWRPEQLGADAIVIGSRDMPALEPVSCIATMEETHLRARHAGPISVPVGDLESGARGALHALLLAARLGLPVVFYHATWRVPAPIMTSSPEQQMLVTVARTLRDLRREADRIGVRHQACVETDETAPSIAYGVVECAMRFGCSLIVMARSRTVLSGSHVDQVLKQSPIPVLVAGRKV